MIFALLDYLDFRRCAGRYDPKNIVGPMAAAWEESVPDSVLKVLPPGAILATANHRSVGAWAIMYGTRSHVSHIAVYISERMIGHMIPGSGATTEPVDALFGPHRRILPFVPSILLEAPPGERISDYMKEHEGEPYGYSLIVRKAIAIITGRWWPIYRFTLLCDFVLATLGMDALLWWLAGVRIPFVTLAYLAVVIINGVRWQLRPVDIIRDNKGGWPELIFATLGPGHLVGNAWAMKDRHWEGATYFRTPEGEASAATERNREAEN
jgi:hypothetical protein